MAGNKRWTKAEISTLRNEYGREDISILAKKLSRSIDAIHWKAAQLDIEFKRLDALDINNRLQMVERKLDLLVEMAFSEKDIKASDLLYIRENYYSFSMEKMAEDLKIPVFRVRIAIRKMLNDGLLLKKYGGDQSLFIF